MSTHTKPPFINPRTLVNELRVHQLGAVTTGSLWDWDTEPVRMRQSQQINLCEPESKIKKKLLLELSVESTLPRGLSDDGHNEASKAAARLMCDALYSNVRMLATRIQYCAEHGTRRETLEQINKLMAWLAY